MRELRIGSRGLALAALAAEWISLQRSKGEPPPLERDLLDAIDPARELLRGCRSRRSG